MIPSVTPSLLILIQADDLGLDDLGFAGQALAHTPYLDRLSRKSVLATDFTVNPVCAPSRATLLTGRHFLRTGISHVHGGKDFLHPAERTMAEAFSAEGWATGMWGKWHSGRGQGYEPWQRGFDEALALDLYQHENPAGELNGERQSFPAKWADGVIVDHAIKFLEELGEGPGFLYLPTMTPHTPLKAPADWIEFHRQRGLPENLAVLYAMISALDAEIGRLLDYLEAKGKLDETLIVFTSDNGPAINRGILTDEERSLRKVSARRGWKGDLWENGVRAPLLFHWPKGLAQGVVRCPLDQIDLMPTLLDFCGLSWPESFPKLDGGSQRSLIEDAGRSASPEGHEPIFNYAHPGWLTSKRAYDPVGLPGEYNPLSPKQKFALEPSRQAISVRSGRFKLLLNPFPPEEEKGEVSRRILVDLWEDPGETTDVAGAFPEVAAELEGLLVRWFEEIRGEAHSFTAPRITLGETSKGVIPARLPCRLEGGLQNSVRGLRGWNQAPAAATYDIVVEETFTGKPVLVWHPSAMPSPGITFRLQAGNGTVSALTDGSERTAFPLLSFPAGRVELQLRLDHIPEDESVNLSELLRIDCFNLGQKGQA